MLKLKLNKELFFIYFNYAELFFFKYGHIEIKKKTICDIKGIEKNKKIIKFNMSYMYVSVVH